MSARPAVLVVDDSADYRRILSRVLAGAGFEPLAVGGAAEARELLARLRALLSRRGSRRPP